MSQENAQELTQEESNLLVAAMLTAHLQGDEGAVESLAGLASDPARVRQVLSEVKGGGEEAAPQGKNLRVSPFRGRR